MSSVSTSTVEDQKVELVAADTALLSLRSSGHDYCSAVGEVIDNSLQARANNIRCRIFTDKEKIGKNKRATEVVSRVAVGDDGDGMDRLTLHKSLMLGYSTRYNDRTGMGRFGVGAKMGGISQAKQIDIYCRQSRDVPWLHTYIDLDKVSDGSMKFIPSPDERDLPDDCMDLPGEKGTLVVWSKTDRLAESEAGGGRKATTVKNDLIYYIGRTFRKFINSGIVITVDETEIHTHDPLFLMESTRLRKDGTSYPPARIVLTDSFEQEIPHQPGRMSKVHITLTLLPEETRRERGKGGEGMSETAFKDNEGFSILRADREIFRGYLRDVQPSLDGKPIDRFIGKEIRFEPDLDECFRVRNVKKGAEPIDGLRDKLKERVHRTITTVLRPEIQDHFDKVKAQIAQEEGQHAEAEQVAAETARTARKSKAGKTMTPEERDKQIEEAADSLTKEVPEENRETKKRQAKARLEGQPISIIPDTWRGQEFIDVKHTGLNALVHMNMKHPFYVHVYSKLVAAEKQDEDKEAKEMARVVRAGIDLLVVAYARAEGLYDDKVIADPLEGFRTNWGLELRDLIQHWSKRQ